jgi:hypothetical protein
VSDLPDAQGQLFLFLYFLKSTLQTTLKVGLVFFEGPFGMAAIVLS